MLGLVVMVEFECILEEKVVLLGAGQRMLLMNGMQLKLNDLYF